MKIWDSVVGRSLIQYSLHLRYSVSMSPKSSSELSQGFIAPKLGVLTSVLKLGGSYFLISRFTSIGRWGLFLTLSSVLLVCIVYKGVQYLIALVAIGRVLFKASDIMRIVLFNFVFTFLHIVFANLIKPYAISSNSIFIYLKKKPGTVKVA